MASVDFQRIVDHQLTGRWHQAGEELADIAKRLEDAGAEAIALAVNTMHKVADPIHDVVAVPFLDIREAVAAALKQSDAKRAVLLGTNYVAKEDYYFGQIANELRGKVELSILPDEEQSFVHDVIYNELSKGSVNGASRMRIADAIKSVISQDQIYAVALASTELPMLNLEDLLGGVPVVDSTSVHIKACVDFIVRDA